MNTGFSLLFWHDVHSSVIDVPVLFRGLAHFIVPPSGIAVAVTRSVWLSPGTAKVDHAAEERAKTRHAVQSSVVMPG